MYAKPTHPLVFILKQYFSYDYDLIIEKIKSKMISFLKNHDIWGEDLYENLNKKANPFASNRLA